MAAAAVMHSAPSYDPLRDHDPGCGHDHVASYWAATAGPAPDDDGPLRGDSEVDIAIIGGGGLAFSLQAGQRLAARLVGQATDEPAIPTTTSPLPRFPLAALRRLGQRAAIAWLQMKDNA